MMESADLQVTKRLMGFEPTTFCMASRRSSQLSYSRAEADTSSSLGYRTLGRGTVTAASPGSTGELAVRNRAQSA
jgi:hypothetical protein